jgi:DNA-binding transcriptional LysR family regulator
MEIRQLMCVEAVARHRHFTRAAEELHLAQSALSHQIVATRRGSAITTALEQRFAEAGARLHLALESGDPLLLRSLAARGFANTLLPRSFTGAAGAGLEVRHLEPPILLPVALLRRRARNLPPAARAFIEFVRGATTTAEAGTAMPGGPLDGPRR